MNSLTALTDIDVTDAAFKANPFPFYARMRREAPVLPVTLRQPFQRKAWLVTRYSDAQIVLRDERFLKDPRSAMSSEQWRKAPRMPPVFKPLQRNLLAIDAPDHARLRALVQKAFTPRRIEHMREQVRIVADELLESVARKGGMELISDFALPLPLIMIGRILGVPAKDNAKFHRWTRVFVSAGASRNPFVLIPNIAAFIRYLRRLIVERRANPTDDLITALVQAAEDNESMTDEKILSMIFLLLSAGHETTVNLIGNGVLALLEHRDQWERLCSEPNLSKSAVEEMLRFGCPVEMATERYPTEDITIGGVTIPRGELTLAVVGSANRDAAVFERPEKPDITRENNRHLTFGQGAHYCLGASLARLEAQIAFGTLAERLLGLRLTAPADTLRWRSGFILRGLTALPVRF